MNNVLITGGAGFIGSNFIEFYCNKYPNDKVVNLDLLTYAGNLENLKDISSNKNYIFYQGDICDIKLVEKIINTHKINIIIHFAAESHVDNSISSPDVFVKTNVNGTFNLLYSAYKTWFEEPFKAKVGDLKMLCFIILAQMRFLEAWERKDILAKVLHMLQILLILLLRLLVIC